MSKNKVIITQKEIKLLSKGEVPERLNETPFVIMRSYVKMITSQDTNWIWTIDFSPEKNESLEIDRSTALSIIKSNGMTKAYSSPEGQVYEMPGKPFHRLFSS